MCRVQRVSRGSSDLLEEDCITARICLPMLIRGVQGFGVLGILREALGQCVELPRIHGATNLSFPESLQQRRGGAGARECASLAHTTETFTIEWKTVPPMHTSAPPMHTRVLPMHTSAPWVPGGQAL